jgi:hypothetical protein
MESSEAAASKPTAYEVSPLSLISFFGKKGGIGESASAMRASLTDGCTSNAIATYIAMSGMITFIDSSDRTRSAGCRKSQRASPGVA